MNFAIGATTLTLLIVLPLPVYVAIKQLVAWTIMGVGIAITIDRSVRTARQTGFAGTPDRGVLDLAGPPVSGRGAGTEQARPARPTGPPS
ncbi:MAG TPA: hypothetical protein VJ804_06140, partial [Acidimicrobiales bacterium]|nr:hypothetical protein [Acidimicrobiales bacterium]